jgi:hypothetical protein
MNAYFASKWVEVDAETLLTNLFDAYVACKDNNFVTYIKQKKQEHNEGGAWIMPSNNSKPSYKNAPGE